jgi:hypothetical protein
VATEYYDVPDLFARFPEDDEDPELAGKLNPAEWSSQIFRAVRDGWIIEELLEGEPVVVECKIPGGCPGCPGCSTPVVCPEGVLEQVKTTVQDLSEAIESDCTCYCLWSGGGLYLLDVRQGDGTWRDRKAVDHLAGEVGAKTPWRLYETTRVWPSRMEAPLSRRMAIIRARDGFKTDRGGHALGVFARHGYLQDDRGFPLRWKLVTADFSTRETVFELFEQLHKAQVWTYKRTMRALKDVVGDPRIHQLLSALDEIEEVEKSYGSMNRSVRSSKLLLDSARGSTPRSLTSVTT